MLIIGLSGKMGSGKDFIAKHVIRKYLKLYYPNLNVYSFSFADPLKMQVLEQYDLSWNDVFPPLGVPKTEAVRKILQTHGNTKRQTNPNYWVDCYDMWCKLFQQKECDILITSDVRFRVEYKHILEKNGIVCNVHAPSRIYQNELTKDISENDLNELSDQDYFYVFQNDSPFQGLNDYKDFFDRLDKVITNRFNK